MKKIRQNVWWSQKKYYIKYNLLSPQNARGQVLRPLDY
jgi:hypothetical protein